LSFDICNCEVQVISKVEICAMTSDRFVTQILNFILDGDPTQLHNILHSFN